MGQSAWLVRLPFMASKASKRPHGSHTSVSLSVLLTAALRVSRGFWHLGQRSVVAASDGSECAPKSLLSCARFFVMYSLVPRWMVYGTRCEEISGRNFSPRGSGAAFTPWPLNLLAPTAVVGTVWIYERLPSKERPI